MGMLSISLSLRGQQRSRVYGQSWPAWSVRLLQLGALRVQRCLLQCLWRCLLLVAVVVLVSFAAVVRPQEATVAAMQGAAAVAAAALPARCRLHLMLRGLLCATRLCAAARAAPPLLLLGRP